MLLANKFPRGVIAIGGGISADATAYYHVECTTPERVFDVAGKRDIEFYSSSPKISPRPDQPGNVVGCRRCGSSINGDRHVAPPNHQRVVRRI